MAGATRIYGGLGGATLPLAATDIDDTALVFRDSAQLLLLDLLGSAVNYELADAWTKVCAALPADSLLAASTLPVAEGWTLYPSKEHLTSIRTGWPLLAVTRKEAATAEFFTVDTRIIRQKWEVSWILGPLGVAEAAKLQGALPYFYSIVERVLAKKGHAAYQSGALALAEETSPFLAIEASGFAAGFAQVDQDGPQLLATTVELSTIEKSSATTEHLLEVDGIELHENLANTGETTIADWVVDDTTGTPPS